MSINSLERKIKTYSDSAIHSNQKLRDLFFLYNDFKNRGQFKLHKRIVSSGKQHFDFDLNAQEYFYRIPHHIHTERPDIQESFNNSLLSILAHDIHIHKTELAADQTTKHIKKWMRARTAPHETKQTLINYFKRHIGTLKLKKFKLIQSLTRSHQNVKSKINLLDFEILSIIKRRQRLKCEDEFEKALQTVGERPR